MITLISLIVVAIGVANWFSIGAFQYDFVAGLFGSQANIFSRFVYVIVGIAGVMLAYSIIRNKGKLVFKNKSDKALFSFGKKATANAESSNDNSLEERKNNMENERHSVYDSEYTRDENLEASNDNHIETYNNNSDKFESSYDNSIDDNIQEKANRINEKNRLSTKNYHTESSRDNYRNNNRNREE